MQSLGATPFEVMQLIAEKIPGLKAKIYNPNQYMVALYGSTWVAQPFVVSDIAIGSSAARFAKDVMKAAIKWPAANGAEVCIQ